MSKDYNEKLRDIAEMVDDIADLYNYSEILDPHKPFDFIGADGTVRRVKLQQIIEEKFEDLQEMLSKTIKTKKVDDYLDFKKMADFPLRRVKKYI